MQLDGMFHVESGHLILAHDNDVYTCEPVKDHAHEWRLFKGTSRTWLIQGELDTCLNRIADFVLPLAAEQDSKTVQKIKLEPMPQFGQLDAQDTEPHDPHEDDCGLASYGDLAKDEAIMNSMFDRWTKEVQREPGEDLLS